MVTEHISHIYTLCTKIMKEQSRPELSLKLRSLYNLTYTAIQTLSTGFVDHIRINSNQINTTDHLTNPGFRFSHACV